MDIFNYIKIEMEDVGKDFSFFKEEELSLFKGLLSMTTSIEKIRIRNRVIDRRSNKESFETLCSNLLKYLQEGYTTY